MPPSVHPLHHREELHRAIVQSSPNPIFLVDCASRRIIDANPATAELLGYELDDLLGRELDAIDMGSARDLDTLISLVRRHHHEILGERLFRRADGRTVPVEASANLVIYREREVVCFFARDVTERREAMRESARLQRALTLSQKHEAVGRLAAGLAHDFNNQLMVMLLCAEFVSQRLGPADPSQEELRDLIAAGRSASDLIRQLLAFSGQQLLRPALLDVDDVLRQQEKMLSRALGEDVRVEVHYGAGGAQVFFDRTQLDQVILNLAVNARDAMPQGGTFRVETSVVALSEDFVRDYATLQSGPHVLIRVGDTGVGMDDATLARIFEPFFTTKGPGKGTGLGLATVYGIVKQSGGSIWASSEPGKGTEFKIYLPVADQVGADPTPQEDAAWSDVPRGTETILLVDDEDSVRTLASKILRELGYTVLEAAGTEDALDLWSRHHASPEGGIDLIVADVVLHDGTGPDFVKTLVQRGHHPKVIFMSGYSFGKLSDPDSPVPDAILLEKPLGRTDLAEAVRATLDR